LLPDATQNMYQSENVLCIVETHDKKFIYQGDHLHFQYSRS